MSPIPLHVLLVEDHAPLREQVAAALRAAGCRVSEAADGRLALQQAVDELPDVLVLDLGLPGLDGLQVCRRLRAQAARHVPVLMLTARDALPDKLQGFEAGADDYLVKPFAPEELLARVRALAQRPAAGRSSAWHVGPLQVDRRSGECWRDGQRLALPPTPAAILRLLAEAHPRALTRSELVRRLWDDEPPDSDPLRSHIHLLRQVLDKPHPGAPMLVTVHGLGFRLQVPPA